MDIGRLLIVLGLAVAVVGLAVTVGGRLGLGRLPGDFVIERGGVRVYLPVATSILVSIVVSVLLWLIGR